MLKADEATTERAKAKGAALLRAEVAERIAREVRQCPSEQAHKLAKVSSLLQAFRVSGESTRLADVRSCLERVGIELDSGWTDDSGAPDIRRSGVVRLSEASPTAKRAIHGDDSGVRLTIWRTGRVGSECPSPWNLSQPDEGVLWFDIDAPERPEEIESRAVVLAELLGARCRGLDVEMLRDLLREDLQPKVETYGDEGGSVRSVSVVAAIARELPGCEGDSDGVDEQVIFQPVEFLVGEGWIATCWHRSQTCGGADNDQSGAPVLKEPFLSEVRRRWVSATDSPRPKTAGDLGVYLARSLVRTYDATHRMMERWMAHWEVEFYTSLRCKERAERLKEAASEISDSLYLTAEIRRRLTAFQHARWSTSDRTWFPNLSDHSVEPVGKAEVVSQVDQLAASLESAKQNFDRLSGDIRANMDVLMLQSAATQQESTERVQNYLSQVTGLVLVPTLIAGLFGANTALPGGGSWMGFELMLLLMMASGIVVYFIIRRLTH